jgi:hypothetical protein
MYAMRKTGATTYSGDGYVNLGSGYGATGIVAGDNSNGVVIGSNGSNDVRALGFTYSGSTTTTGSWTSTGVTGSASIDVLSIAYNSINNNYLMISRFWTGSTGGVNGVGMTLSGTTLTIGSPVLVSNSISGSYPVYQYVSYNPIANYYVVFYENYSNSNYGATSLVTVTGTTVSLVNTTQNATSDRPGYAYTAFNPSNARTGLIYSSGGSAGQITFREVTLNYTGAPTATSFAGFSSGSYSNGQTATVKINGNTSTQSGLTPATKYYLTPGGLLTTSTTDVYAGIAASSTTLLIKA